MKYINPNIKHILNKFRDVHPIIGIRQMEMLFNRRYFSFDDKNFIEVTKVADIKHGYLAVYNELHNSDTVDIYAVDSIEDGILKVLPNPDRNSMTNWITRQEQGYLVCHVFNKLSLLTQQNTEELA